MLNKVKLFLIVILILSLTFLSVHDSLHKHNHFHDSSEYRLNISRESECAICDVEKIIGEFSKNLSLFFGFLILVLVLKILFLIRISKLDFIFTNLTPIDLYVRMNN